MLFAHDVNGRDVPVTLPQRDGEQHALDEGIRRADQFPCGVKDGITSVFHGCVSGLEEGALHGLYSRMP